MILSGYTSAKHGEKLNVSYFTTWCLELCPRPILELSAFDMDRLIDNITNDLYEVEMVIVEGILIFDDWYVIVIHPLSVECKGPSFPFSSRLDELTDIKFFVTLPYDVCKARRQLRNYQPPEPYPEYFDVMYWPVYQRQLQESVHRPDFGRELLLFS